MVPISKILGSARAQAACRAAYHGTLARVVPVELPPAVEKSPVSEPLPWHPDHEDIGLMILAGALDSRLPYEVFAQ